MSNKPGPLTGVRVVTSSTAQAGTVPYMPVADLRIDLRIDLGVDLGAEAIKIETPGVGEHEERNILPLPVLAADDFRQNFRPGACDLGRALESDEPRDLIAAAKERKAVSVIAHGPRSAGHLERQDKAVSRPP